MIVKTGLGYICEKATGNVICKYCLPAGKHPLKPAYEAVETANQAELDLIVITTEPVSQKQADEIKIQAEIRKLAVDSLKAKGQLAVDYK